MVPRGSPAVGKHFQKRGHQLDFKKNIYLAAPGLSFNL